MNHVTVAIFCDAVVVVLLPQTPEDDLISARAVCGRWSSWSQLVMCVVSHGYGGLDWSRDGGGGWHECKSKLGGGCMSGDVGTHHEYEVIHW